MQAVVHVVLEETPAGVAELVEEEHEEHGQAVADQQLDGQQRRAHVLVEVRLEEVPERDEEEVLDEASRVVHGQPAPALLPLDELSMGEIELHRWPAEDVDAGVEQREHAQHNRGAQLWEVFLHAFSQWPPLGPELTPGEEEEEKQVRHAHKDHPVGESRAEEDQSGDPGGNLQASPYDHAEVRRRSQPHLVVVVSDLNGQNAAHQGPVRDGDEGDDHQSHCEDKHRSRRWAWNEQQHYSIQECFYLKQRKLYSQQLTSDFFFNATLKTLKKWKLRVKKHLQMRPITRQKNYEDVNH